MLKKFWDFILMTLGVSSGDLVEEDKWAKYREQNRREGDEPRGEGAIPEGPGQPPSERR